MIIYKIDPRWKVILTRKACIGAFYDSNKIPDEIYEELGENSYNDGSDHENV